MNSNDIKDFLKQAYKDVIENMDDWEKYVQTYFSLNYSQCIDGNIHNLTESLDHIREIKRDIERVYFEFVHLMSEENKIFSIHYAFITKKNGSRFKLKGIALFELRDEKFISCDELTKEMEWLEG